MQAAVFIDKDGTLIENHPFNVDPDRIALEEGAAQALPRLRAAGYQLIVVSNQSGIALGYFKEKALIPVRDRIQDLLRPVRVPLAGFYYCPHRPLNRMRDPSKACDCRKPKPGLIVRAARDLKVDLTRSWMVGDILDDIEAGRRAGCRTVLVDRGHETEWVLNPFRTPHFVAKDLNEAADIILRATGRDKGKARHGTVVGRR